MKKIILFLVLLNLTVTAQTVNKKITGLCYDSHGWYVTFNDEQGNGNSILYSLQSLGLDSLKSSAMLGTIQDRLDTLPYIYNQLKSVQLISYSSTNGIFTIIGQKGFPVILNTNSLTGNNATIKSNFYSFVHNATGQNLSTLVANFDGSDSIYINGIKMNTDSTDSLSGGLVMQAKQMCLLLLNGANP